MPDSMKGRVLVGIAPTLAGYQALRYAVGEARRRRAELLVVRTYRASGTGAGVVPRSVLTAVARDQIAQVVRDALGGWPAGVRVREVIREGAPGAVLCATADRPGDVIIIGGSGRWRPWGGRRGTVARRCARAACPVTIVPPPSLQRALPATRPARAAVMAAEAVLRAAAPPV